MTTQLTKNLKYSLLQTQWGGTISCDEIDPGLNGGVGAWPTFKNNILTDIVGLNNEIEKEVINIINNDKEVQQHFIQIGLQNFIKEEMAREDFHYIESDYQGQENYITATDDEYFREIFLEDNAKFIVQLKNGTFYLYN